MLELTAEEARVVASLAEKQLTTPQYYPLTLNALVNACNQSNNRDPVVSYSAEEVVQTMASLRAKGVARMLHAGGGNRTEKYRHVLDEALGLDARELAIVTVLLLRGAQTVNELRTRTERMAGFADAGPGAIEHDLDRLAARDEPLVRRVERRSGQKEARWISLLMPLLADGDAGAGPSAARGSDTSRARRAEVPAPVVAALDQLDRNGAVDDATWSEMLRLFRREPVDGDATHGHE